jgi:hypothetical protein
MSITERYPVHHREVSTEREDINRSVKSNYRKGYIENVKNDKPDEKSVAR